MKKKFMALLLAVAMLVTSNGFIELGTAVAHAAEATTDKKADCDGEDEKAHKNIQVSFKWAKDNTCKADITCKDCGNAWKDQKCEVTSKITKESTCTVKGEKTYTATIKFAEKTYTNENPTIEAVALAAHTPEVTKEAVAPTCDKEGSTEEKTCTECKKVIVESKPVAKIAHTYKVTKEAKAATCTEAGYTEEKTCEKCGDVVESTIVEATGHKYETPIFTWAADNKECIITFNCEGCETTRVEKTDDIDNKVTKKATCTETGIRTYTATCKCGEKHTDTKEEVIPALGHEEKEVTAFKWNKDHTKCTVTVTCTRCDAKLTKDATVTVDDKNKATCEKAGEIVYTATYIIDEQPPYTNVYIETDEPGHNFVVDVPAKAATCTEAGCTEGTRCTRCEKVGVSSRTIKAKGHNYVEIAGKAATCTTDGYTTSTQCSACGDVKKAAETIPAGHSYGKPDFEWKGYTACKAVFTCSACKNEVSQDCKVTSAVKTAATCKAEGETEYTATCTFENETYTTKAVETTAKLAHTEKVTKSPVAATCETAGNTEEITCSVCNTVIKAFETIPATGHKEKTVAGFAATCVEEGKTDAIVCETCGKMVKNHEVIAPMGHKEITKAGKAATCTEAGYTDSVVCATCDVVLEPAKEIPAGHEYKLTDVTWSDDFKKCSATIVCNKCDVMAANQQCSYILQESSVLPTCTADGGDYYQAAFEYDGQALATERTLDESTAVSKLGHAYEDDICTRCSLEKPYSEITFVKESTTISYTGKAISVPKDAYEVTAGTGKVTFEYYVDEGCVTPTFSGNEAKETKAPSAAGVYFAKAIIAADDEYRANVTENTFKITVRPRRVPSLTATNAASTIKLTWEKRAEADGYIIYRKTADTEYKAIKTITGNSTLTYNDGNITQGKQYRYNIVAYRNAKNGTQVKSLKREAGTNIARAKVISVTNNNGSVVVKWTKLTGVAGYKVYRKASGYKSYELIKTIKDAATNTYTDKTSKTLRNGKASYYYVVPYFKSTSNVVVKTNTKTNYYVTRPTSVEVTTPKTKALKVAWKKNSSATGYQVRYSTSSSMENAVTVNTTSLSKTFSGLTKNKTYYVQVRSYKTYSDVKYYSAWTAKKSKKTK